MKAISRKFKKHVINNPDQLGGKYDGYDDIMQPRASFRPLQSPNLASDGGAKKAMEPTCSTLQGTRKKIYSEKVASAISPVQDRKNTSCPPSAVSTPILSLHLRSSTDGSAPIKTTSFSSSKFLKSSENNFSNSNTVFSFTDLVLPVRRDSQNSSLSALSVSSSPEDISLSASASSHQLHISLGEDQSKTNKDQTSFSPESSNSGIFKKLNFYRKDKERHVKKQNSKENFYQSKLGSSSIDQEDVSQSSERLEKFKEENEALELEVRGKDEEVRMLNATIDQVNQTWENKLQAMMRDLEEEKRRNDHLRAKLTKETSAAANAKKSTIRIPVDQRARAFSDGREYHPRQAIGDTDSVASATFARIISPRVKRKGIREINRKLDVNVTIHKKEDDVKQKLVEALMSSTCLSLLSRDDLISIADVMNNKRINRGERLMQEGVLGQAFYVLGEGDCRIYKRNQESVSPNLSEGGRPVKQWEIFGEADVFYHTRRVWSCKCVRPGSVWFITRDEFRAAVMQQDIQRRKEEIAHFLKDAKSFSKLEALEFRMLANVSRVMQYAEGDYIIRQGSSSSSIYILKEGEVTVTKIIDGSETRLQTLTSGQILGTSLLSSRHQHNVVASGKEVVQCIAIPLKHFEKVRDHVTLPQSDVTATKVTASLARRDLLGDGQDSLSSGHTGSVSSGYGSDQNSPNIRRRRNKKRYDESHTTNFAQKASFLESKSMNDFENITTIGNGAFGTVNLVKLKQSEKNVFAVKKICRSEDEVSEQQKKQNVYNEENIQISSSRDCPFIASLFSTFKDNRYVYFVMEFCQGGELFSLLSRGKAFGDAQACFYAGCILEALAYLHARHIIFRDLKPENMVIDKDGYCKLTDFGFAKKVSAKSSFRTYSYCGTPEYMAPETILYRAQSFAVDIWSLGVFIFEMLDGKAPFPNKNPVALAESILGGIEPPLKVSKTAKRIGKVAGTLIRDLCHNRPEDRLGVGRNGIADVSRHPWFNKMDWEALRLRKLTPPWKPMLINERDLRYFNSATKSKHTADAIRKLSGWDESF